MEAARALYTTLGSAALPLLPLRLWWRGRKEPGYRRQISERFGRYRGNVTDPVYWIHAVSVGETRAATPLVMGENANLPEVCHGIRQLLALVQTRGWRAMMKRCNGSSRSKICSKDGTSTDRSSFCA